MDAMAGAKHYLLHLLIKNKEMYLDDLQNSMIFAFARLLSTKEINKMILRMKKAGLIDVKEVETKEYKQCVEEYNNKKTVKNPYITCKKKYPVDITISITETGEIAYIQSVYCLSLALGDSRLTALENMKMVEEELGVKTVPPPDCRHVI